MAENELDFYVDEELEHLFHSDLQNLELGHEETSHDDVIGDHLPEWLVGVIVVIIMLIVAFFVMIITSLIKNRKKNRSSSYIGTGSSVGCDDLESGKVGHSGDPSMKMTGFSTGTVPEDINDSSITAETVLGTCDQQILTASPRRGDDMHGAQGCRNPLFVDDDPESDDNNNDGEDYKKGEGGDKNLGKRCETTSGSSVPSTSDGQRGNDVKEHGRSKGMPHKYKHSSAAKKSLMTTKSMEAIEDQFAEHDCEARKRIFASKQKSSNKKEKNKGVSIGGNNTSHDEDGITKDAEKEGEVSKSDSKLGDVLSSNRKNSKSKDGNEDSGVELGPSESPTKENSPGDSENQEAFSGSTMTQLSELIEYTGNENSGHSKESREHPETITNSSPSHETSCTSPIIDKKLKDDSSENEDETFLEPFCPQSPTVNRDNDMPIVNVSRSSEQKLESHIFSQDPSTGEIKEEVLRQPEPETAVNEETSVLDSLTNGAETSVESPTVTETAPCDETSYGDQRSPSIKSVKQMPATDASFTEGDMLATMAETALSSPTTAPSSPATASSSTTTATPHLPTTNCYVEETNIDDYPSFSTNL